MSIYLYGGFLIIRNLVRLNLKIFLILLKLGSDCGIKINFCDYKNLN